MIQRDPAIEEFELKLEVEELNRRERLDTLKIQNDLEVAKLKIKTVEKRKMWERVLLAIVKAPALLMLSLTLPILLMANRQVPEQILNFLNL